MNFTKYFKRKDYDNLDRFLLQQKFRSCRDPFEGDPFKIQSLNFRYADKPKFYPISNRSKTFENGEKPFIQNRLYNQSQNRYSFEKENKAVDSSKQSQLLKNARKSSSIYSFSGVSKPGNIASNSMPESFQRRLNSAAKKNYFNRSRSFIDQPMSVPFTEEAALPNHQYGLKTNILKAKNGIGIQKRTDLMPAINVDHNGGCKITIKINGVPSNQVHINDKVENYDFSQNRRKSIGKPATPKATSSYEIKPSRSYVIHRDDTAAGICSEPRKSSSRKLLREYSTHSMIPHKEEKGALKELKKSSSIANTIGGFSSPKLKSGSRDSTQLNLSRKVSQNVCLDSNLARKNSFMQRTLSGINLEKQASILEKIISNNPIVAPTRKSFLLNKSKSVLDQRFTPLPMSRKYTFDNTNSRIH